MSTWKKEKLRNIIDEAYREKYEGSQYLPSMIRERASKAAIKIVLT